MSEPRIGSLTLSDGCRAAVRWWRPSRPRGAVLYFHGIQSHGGWYERSGARLAEAGLTVLMPDRRGSGLNTVGRGHAESAEQCVRDGREFLDALLRETELACAHVVGVSWGGKLAVALAEDAGDRVRSITLVAPGLFPRVDVPGVDKFRIAMSLVADRTRMFDIPLNEPSLFTANPERRRFVERDALKLTQVSAAFLLATRRLDRPVRRFTRTRWSGGVHLFLAGLDRIIQNERTRAWLRGLPMPDRQITEYPAAEHTIEFEDDPRVFLEDMACWIAERCDSGGRQQTSPPDPAAVHPSSDALV